MKKLLAVILSAVLMLSVCAFTEGPEAGTCYCLSGISLEAGVNPEKTVTIDEDVTDPDTGEVLVPAGDYKVSSFTVDKELLIKILGNMTLNGEPIPNVEMLKDENTDAMLTGAIYEGQGDLQTSVGYMFITASDGEVEGYNGGYYIMSTDEDGTTFTFDVLGDGGESHLDAQFVVEKHAVTEATFGPDDVDMANVINLSELAAAGEESPLMEDMQTWLGDVIGSVVIAMIGEVPAE